MVMESKFGQMEPNMRASGEIMLRTVGENFGMLMETFTMENGETIRRMGLEPTHT